MGLDMFLYKVKRQEVAYWRKANEIHAWIERRLEDDVGYDGIENCREYHLSKEDLIDLRDTCQKVLDASKLAGGKIKNGERLNNKTNRWEPIYEDGKYITNPEIAEQLLPRADGFFFGSQEYDEWYIDDLKSTIIQINNILETVDFDTEDIVYLASW